MRILSLDASTKSTGWAVMESADSIIQYGCLTASSTDVIKRIYKIRDEIQNLIEEYQPDLIVMEEVLPDVSHNKKPEVWKALTSLQAAIRFMVHDNYAKLKFEFLYPSEWRAKLGIGNTYRGTQKERDMAYVKDNFSIIANDDICDAICLGCSYFIAKPPVQEINGFEFG